MITDNQATCTTSIKYKMGSDFNICRKRSTFFLFSFPFKMKVIITGASGLLGRAVYKTFKETNSNYEGIFVKDYNLYIKFLNFDFNFFFFKFHSFHFNCFNDFKFF